jgi:hypothetical protein
MLSTVHQKAEERSISYILERTGTRVPISLITKWRDGEIYRRWVGRIQTPSRMHPRHRAIQVSRSTGVKTKVSQSTCCPRHYFHLSRWSRWALFSNLTRGSTYVSCCPGQLYTLTTIIHSWWLIEPAGHRFAIFLGPSPSAKTRSLRLEDRNSYWVNLSAN